MSIYATFDDDLDDDEIASNDGWSQFLDWVDGLDLQTYGEVVHLAEHGWCQDLPTLETQLAQALAQSPPEPETRTVAEGLLALVKARGEKEILLITDGTGPEDDDEASAESPPEPTPPAALERTPELRVKKKKIVRDENNLIAEIIEEEVDG
jgi:hypothetical protein